MHELTFMNPYFEMLKEMGVSIDPCEWDKQTQRSASPELPDRPHHYNGDGRAVFTTQQLEWCDPEDFGFTGEYEVVDSGPKYTTEWKDEIMLTKKRYHRYSRVKRFKFILTQLMGATGFVKQKNRDDEVMVMQPFWKHKKILEQIPKNMLWETIRLILKKHKQRIFYNRIPTIIRRLGLVTPSKQSTSTKLDSIMYDFQLMHHVFNQVKSKIGRAYFPNLRYIALKLMAKHGLPLIVEIPQLRTLSKQEELDGIYKTIWVEIENQNRSELDLFFDFN